MEDIAEEIRTKGRLTVKEYETIADDIEAVVASCGVELGIEGSPQFAEALRLHKGQGE